MKFLGPLLAVKDINISKSFYENVLSQKTVLDFGINVSFESGFSIQQNFAELVGFDPATVQYKTHNFEIYFEVEDMDNWNTRLKNTPGLEFMHDIKEYPWGQRVLRIYDPDMHIIEIGESMECVVKRFLAQGLSVEETSKRTQFPIEFVKNCL